MPDYANWREKPVPEIDPDSEPYWAAAAEGRLVVQRCGDCGERQLYPRSLCRHCGSRDLAFEDHSGDGTVYTYTVCHVSGQPGYDEETPYAVALVELDLPDPNPSGRAVRLTTHVDCPAEDLAVGLPVAVDFARISDDPEIHLPIFRPRE
jgi:uncharacterized OB-fold protein